MLIHFQNHLYSHRNGRQVHCGFLRRQNTQVVACIVFAILFDVIQTILLIQCKHYTINAMVVVNLITIIQVL